MHSVNESIQQIPFSQSCVLSVPYRVMYQLITGYRYGLRLVKKNTK